MMIIVQDRSTLRSFCYYNFLH